MNTTTMQHLGRRPGRARLGACGHLSTRAVNPARGNWAGNWHDPAALCPMYALTGTSVATPTFGQNSIKRPTRHLATRST